MRKIYIAMLVMAASILQARAQNTLAACSVL